MNLRKALLLYVLFGLFSTANSAETYSYHVKHQSPAQLVAAMSPHLEPTTKITVSQKVLLITASEPEYKKIQQMLTMLDKALKNYLVEVKILSRRLDDWETKGTKSANGSNQTQKVTRYQTGSSQNKDKSFRLRLMEGYQGFVETGETFQQTAIVEHYGKFIPKTTNKSLTSGFYLSVLESTNNQVNINISANSQNRKTKYGQGTQSSAANSQFIASKNQWLLIATVNADDEQSNSSKYSTSNPRKNKRFYYLRIKDM